MAHGIRELLQEARSRIQEISATDAETLMAKEPETLFLDVRESEELAGGRSSIMT